MNRSLNRFVMVTLIGTIVSATTFADFCVWDGTTFPGSYGCSNESCGYTCGEGSGYVSHQACKSSTFSGQIRCCICNWVTWSCACVGGVGTASSSTRVEGFGDCPEVSGPGPHSLSCISTD